jgi:hypothetical protein
MQYNVTMPCPICTDLNRENNQECAAEASATLLQRSQSLTRHERSGQDALDLVVLTSRKRQAVIAFKLRQHRAQEHGIEEKRRSATA